MPQRRNGPVHPYVTRLEPLHFDVATPNFLIQEEMSGVVSRFGEVLSGLPVLVNGHWAAPDKPGLGIEINEKIAAAHPYKPEPQNASAAVLDDGTVVDW